VGGWVCKPILVFYFGPNQTFGPGLRLGPSRTKDRLSKNIPFSWLKIRLHIKMERMGGWSNQLNFPTPIEVELGCDFDYG
jgi:hypothetical protein